MDKSKKSVLITGGAGFIGSHLADRLVNNNINTIVYDNFSTGNRKNLTNCLKKTNFELIVGDLNNSKKISSILPRIKTVFHIAAYPEVRTGFENPEIAFNENIKNTYLLLEQIRKSSIEKIVFASSSVVYGDAKKIPTGEEYGPLLPISPYGGSKLACEGLISAYCHNYGIQGIILRFANVIGSRSKHGVIWDFINKLHQNKKKLEILGDGTQTKSYIHISDCVDGFLKAADSKNPVDVFNIGNNDRTSVTDIANIVIDKMNLKNVKIITKGGTPDGRGWPGDVKKMHLDIKKLKRIGWKPKYASNKAVEISVDEILKEI